MSVVNRDRKRKRFVRETGKEDQKKKKIKTDGGQVIANKTNRKNLYPFDELCLFTICIIYYCAVVSLNNISVMRNGRRNTGSMMQSQTEKQEEGRDHKQVKDYWILEKSMYSAHYSEDSVQLSILIIFLSYLLVLSSVPRRWPWSRSWSQWAGS